MAVVKREQIDELTGLRGIAAGLIILNHLLLLFPILRKTELAPFLGYCGTSGMALFFILSGFVIYYNYTEKIQENYKEGIKNFLIARFARLYPLYFLFISGFFIYNCFKTPEMIAENTVTFPTFIAGMQSWVYGFVNGTALVHLQGSSNISWSISTEFGLYLFFIPLALFVFKNKSFKSIVALFLFAVVGHALWVYFAYFNPFLTDAMNSLFGVSKDLQPWEWLVFHSPFGRIYQFIAGCAIAQYFMYKKEQSNSNLLSICLLICGIVGYIYMMFFNGFAFTQKPGQFVVPVLLMFIVFAITDLRCKFLTKKIFIFLGEISYSSYLLHIIFILLFGYARTKTYLYVINFIAFFVCTYLCAWLSYKYIESPMRRTIKEFFANNDNVLKMPTNKGEGKLS